MKNFARFSGAIGVVFIIFGAVASIFFQGELQYAGFTQFAVGILGISMFCFFFIGDAVKMLARKRESIYGIVGGLLLVFILIGINVFAHSKYGEKKFDTTVNKVHSLSDASKDALKKLNETILIISFFQDARMNSLVSNIVEQYTYETDKITFKTHDPDKEPALAEKYDSAGNELVVINEATGKNVKISSPSEEEITTAIRRVIVAKKIKAYFLQGHGEGDLDDDKTTKGLFIAKLLLEREGYEVAPLNLVETPEVPKDANLVAAWGAKRALSKREIGILENYLERGGSVIIAQDPLLTTSKDKITPSGFEPLLKKYGLQFHSSVVLAKQLRLLQAPVIDVDIPMANYGDHPITEKLGNNSFTQLFISQPVIQSKSYKGDAKRTALVSTSDSAWAETDVKSLFIAKKATANGDTKGPLAIGQIAEWPVTGKDESEGGKKTGKLIVFGDADFGLNQKIQAGYNKDLFLNSFTYLGGEVESISIRPKRFQTSTLQLSDNQKRFVYYSGIFILPEIILCMGIAIWLLRRNRT